MQVTKDFMVALKKEAKALCGGSKHTFEVQTWNGHIDIDGVNLDDNDAIDHLPLSLGATLPDTAKCVDVAVWGYSATFGDIDRLGNIEIRIENGKLVEAWQ